MEARVFEFDVLAVEGELQGLGVKVKMEVDPGDASESHPSLFHHFNENIPDHDISF